MSTYCDQDDIEARFGATNVAAWASLSEGDDAAAQAARVTVAISVASAEIDDFLRARPDTESKLPLDPVPTTIEDKAALRAGLWLYTFRAAADMNNRDSFISWVWRAYRTWVHDLQADKIKLDIR